MVKIREKVIKKIERDYPAVNGADAINRKWVNGAGYRCMRDKNQSCVYNFTWCRGKKKCTNSNGGWGKCV